MCDGNQSKKPAYLGLRCPERQGRHEKCKGCPVLSAGHCEELTSYVQYQVDRLHTSHGYELGESEDSIERENDFAEEGKDLGPLQSERNSAQVDIQRVRKADEDWLTPLQVTFLAIEESVATYDDRSSFKTWVSSINKNKLLTLRRNYNKVTRGLYEIPALLGDYNVLILTGGKYLKERQADYAFAPHNEAVSEHQESLLIIDVRETDLLEVIAQKKSMSILVHGSAQPDKEIIDLVAKKNGVLFWLPEDINKDLVKPLIQSLFRLYVDIVPWTPVGNDDDENIYNEPEIHDLSWMENLDHEELVRDVERCLETLWGKEDLRTCVMYVSYYLSVIEDICNGPKTDDFMFDNGEIRQEYVYKQMAGLLNKKPDAVKKAWSRCYTEGNFLGAIQHCLDAYNYT